MYAGLKEQILAVPESDWVHIDDFGPRDGPGADVAELEYLAFAHRRESVPCRLIVRRKRIDPGSLLDLSPEHRYEYSAFITNRSGGMVRLEADHRQRAETEGYIKDLKYGVGLNHLPSANFNANAA